MSKSQKQPRENKKKEEITADMKKKQHVERQKTLARLIFPAVTNLKTVYDAQTVFNAVAGYIKLELMKEEAKLRVSDLAIDLSKEKDTPIKHAVSNIFELIRDENATDAANLIELMGNKLPEFLANKAVRGPMSQVTAEEFIAD